VLVTGATGFLGGAMVLRLAKDRVSVRALVRAGRNTDLLQQSGAEIAVGDICDPAAVRDAMSGCTHVIHLAARKAGHGVASVTEYDVNVRGTGNVTAAACKEGVARFVYGSTVGVHGFVSRGLVDETSAIRPNTRYRKTKWIGETVVREAHKRDGLPAVVARISSVVGPGATKWLPFVRAVASHRILLIGDGANHIDLVAVEDLIEGLWRCATGPATDGSCFVLGSGESWTVDSFAKAIALSLGVPAPNRGPPIAPYRALMHIASTAFRATGYESTFARRREILVANKATSSTRARADIGYAPATSVELSIGAMIARFISEGSLPASAAPRALRS
jgi:nucleoside-diphosphate-sugar epimerase